MADPKIKKKVKSKRVITDGIVHVHASFNNTIISVTDVKGNLLAQSSAGANNFRGSRKSTPYAAQVAVSKACQFVLDQYGMLNAEVRVWGPGPGRDASVREVRSKFTVTAIHDVTGIPFNGCRAESERRV